MFNHKQQKGEGNAKRKSNRYSILMLALIFIGFATYGTYAYFTDSTSVGSEIKLSTGTVSLGQAVDGKWEYKSLKSGKENQKIKSETDKNQFSNLQPGDSYTMTKKVQYTGTLDAKVSYQDKTELYEEVSSKGFELSIKVEKISYDQTATDLQGKTVDIFPGETVNVTFTVSVPYKNAEAYNANLSRNKVETSSLDLTEVENSVTITVTQNY